MSELVVQPLNVLTDVRTSTLTLTGDRQLGPEAFLASASAPTPRLTVEMSRTSFLECRSGSDSPIVESLPPFSGLFGRAQSWNRLRAT